MTEILWNTNAPHSPRQDHELVELRLVNLSTTEKPSFLVREIHASWSASAQQIRWNGYEDHTYPTPQDAERDFAGRKAVLAQTGFPFTTVVN